MEFDFSKFARSNTTIIPIQNAATKRKFPYKFLAFIMIILIIIASWQFILNVVAWVTVGGSVGLAIKKVGSSILGLGK